MQRVLSFLAFSAMASLSGASSAIAGPATPLWSSVPTDIRAVFDKPPYAKATWGLRVLDGSRTLVDLNSEHPFLIGSVRKVFSVGEMLNTVGPAHTYDTPMYRMGPIMNGTLRGNLILVASGDLTMGGRTNPDGTIAISNWDHNEANGLGNAILTNPDPLNGYRALAHAVRAYGIKRIAGNVVIDDRLFSPFPFRGEFNIRPIFVNDDVVDLSIVPGRSAGAQADVRWRPHSAALNIDNQLRTAAADSPDTLAIDPVFPACIGSAGCTSRISGALPSNFVPPLTGLPTLVQTARIVQPSNYARTVLVEQLKAAGVLVDAPAVEVNPVQLLPAKQSYRRADELAELKGLPYADDAKLVMKISYNIGADMTLMLFGLAHHVDTIPAALDIERQILWSQYGIPSTEYKFIDGSGGGYTTATNAA
jgi:D-alanyl-D-alanine carboxypeptidase